MNFALIGNDPKCLPLVRAVAAEPRHRLTIAASVEPLVPHLLQSASGIRIAEDWQQLLLDTSVGAAIVAGSDEPVMTAAKRLAANGTPLLVFPHADQGTAFAYELALIRDDAQTLILPAFPMRWEATVRRLRRELDAGVLGKLLHLQIEAELPPSNGEAKSPLIPAQAAEAALLHHLDLLTCLGGTYDRVTALRTGVAGDDLTTMTVTLAGENSPEATWTIRSAASHPGARLTVQGERGSAEVVFDGDDKPRRLRIGRQEAPAFTDTESPRAEDERGAEKPNRSDAGRLLLIAFEAAFAGHAFHPDWNDAVRLFEAVGATRRSIARRRTIDLHYEPTSERSIFKSHMTALGCGILLYTLFGLLLYLLVAGLFPLNQALLHWGRIVWLLPPVVFLALQSLLFLAKPSSDKRKRD